MSSNAVSKSSTLRDPKFDDEINVERVSTATQIKTWKIVPSNSVKKLSPQDTALKSMKSFTIETANMFDGIRNETCQPFHIEHTEPDANVIHKNFQNKLKKKEKIKKKNVKKIKNKEVKKIQRSYITDSQIETSPFDETYGQKVKRCNKCFVNHFPSLPKFCRWAEEHADKITRKSMKDNAIGSKKINLSSKNVEIIKRRIHWIDQQINENCNSSQNSKDEIDQKTLAEERTRINEYIGVL